MIIHDFPQGSAAWCEARAGIPTASAFSKVITPKTMQLSSQADAYENRCVFERMTGSVIEDFGGSAWTERGKEFEDEARAAYEFKKNVIVRRVGFVTNDLKTFGCSPDGLIGEDGGLELKCPSGTVHVGYLLSKTGAYDDYKAQVQGNMFVTGAKFWDVMSYHPEMRPSIYTATPDLEFHEKLRQLLAEFEENVQRKIAFISNLAS